MRKQRRRLAVTAKLISAFVFTTWIVQYLYFLNPKFQASIHPQLLCSLVCVRPGQNVYPKSLFRNKEEKKIYEKIQLKIVIFTGIELRIFEPRREKNQRSAYAKTKTQISCAVTAKLNSAFVFATWIIQYPYFLNP